MSYLPQIRKMGCLLGALLLPTFAFATTYTGTLIPGDYSEPITVVLRLRLRSSQLYGTATYLMRNPMEGRVTSGNYNAGLCDIVITFADKTQSNLKGECNARHFEGAFKIVPAPPNHRNKRFGQFKLEREKTPSPADTETAVAEEPAASPAVSCLKKKISCLRSCPMGDYNTEFLCANVCRRKELACKGKVSKAVQERIAPTDTSSHPPPEEDAIP